MRTTIRLNDALLQKAKEYAVSSRRSLTSVIEEALRIMLARKQPPRPRQRIKLPTCNGNGVQPGVDLNDSGALLDMMEGL